MEYQYVVAEVHLFDAHSVLFDSGGVTMLTSGLTYSNLIRTFVNSCVDLQ